MAKPIRGTAPKASTGQPRCPKCGNVGTPVLLANKKPGMRCTVCSTEYAVIKL